MGRSKKIRGKAGEGQTSRIPENGLKLVETRKMLKTAIFRRNRRAETAQEPF